MKLAILTTAILLSVTLKVASQPKPSPTPQKPPIDTSSLNLELQGAVCSQDWKQAIKVVDRMIEAISQPPGDSYKYKGELVIYRGRLQTLINSNSSVPLSELPGCTTGPRTSPTR